MLPFDLSQYSVTARNDLCMAIYQGLERTMATRKAVSGSKKEWPR